MKRKKKNGQKKRASALFLRFVVAVIALTLGIACGIIETGAEENETLPEEYKDFIGSIDGSVADKLPDGVFSDSVSDLSDAAREMTEPAKLLNLLLDILGEGISAVAPTVATLLGCLLIAAIVNAFSSNLGSLAHATEICTRLCTFCIISGTATARVGAFKEYLDSLFAAVSSFLPLCAVSYAMGGNISSAASSATSLGTVLTVCEFICTKTVIPVFALCLCLSLTSVFDGFGGQAGGTLSNLIRKWYMRALSFVMMLLTGALGAQSLITSKADNMAMRSAKFAASSFVPVSGGTVSSTLGTLAASVELLRGSIGTVGIVIIGLMLLPVIVELALLRLAFSIGGFCASLLGCSGEARLLSELDSLYGYLEGVAVLCAVVFVIALGVFASIPTPFS